MKHIRFALLLIASLLLWGCQGTAPIEPTKDKPTPTISEPKLPTVTAAPPTATIVPKIEAKANPNAAINCQTGKTLTSAMPPLLGIGAVAVERQGNQLLFTLTFPRVDDINLAVMSSTSTFVGGIGFIDPDLATPAPDKAWYFNGTENYGINFGFVKTPTPHWVTFGVSHPNTGWTTVDITNTLLTTDRSSLMLQIPESEIVGNTWYASASDSKVCTSVGLGSDGRPMLPLPGGGYSSQTSIASTPPTPTESSVTPIESTPPRPALTGFTASDFQSFAMDLSEALKVNNPTFLFDHLDPAVLSIYGADQCRRHISQRKADPTTKIQVLNVNGSGPWLFTTELGSLQIAQAYTLTANVTQQGVLTQTLVHFGENGDQLDWFTKCTDSSPATVKPTP